jgi:hypothetical protein
MYVSNFDTFEVKPSSLALLYILNNIVNSLFCLGR